MTPRLLFVCSGNLHRSVMAAAITKAMFEELERPVNIASAGTLNLRGKTAPHEVRVVCAEIGIDVSGHRSQGLTRSLIRNADQVIVMAEKHARSTLEFEPESKKKLVYLGDYFDPPGEVWDPIGQDIGRFRECRDMILGALQGYLPVLLEQLED